MCKDCGCSNVQHELFKVKPIGVLRKIDVEESLFQKNQKQAALNREGFKKKGWIVFNVMSSPGAGKTSLLSHILPELNERHPLAVVVGDQETEIDAERLQKAGLRSVQINTHSACHLDAERVGSVLNDLEGNNQLEWVFIENVGNLVCPAVFDLGEKIKVALLSTPEGEEKPLKYPVLFHDADVIVITKSDLIPVLDYNSQKLESNIRTRNQKAKIIYCSLKTGQGLMELKAELERLATCV